MQRSPDLPSLWALLDPARAAPQRFIADARTRIEVRELANGTSLTDELQVFQDRSVMIVTRRQLPAALALVQLDGIARRLLLCTPDLSAAAALASVHDAEIDTILTDGAALPAEHPPSLRILTCHTTLRPGMVEVERKLDTEWVLLTSGTTGRPKLAVHTLSGLTGPIHDNVTNGHTAVWSTFYDVRRYGGLQILLRALAGGGSMILSDADDTVGDFLERAGRGGVTHMSGTPSHWRGALMSERAGRIRPGYVRLSGEACDQAILDNLRHAYPAAQVAHAFASTEAGVAFDVRDGFSGFPASLLDDNGAVEMRVVDGSLRIRSNRTARRYLGGHPRPLTDADGFVDTGDLVERRQDRYYFIGRREGVINVGGLKIHPEAVEAVINEHPAVHMSRVRARRSPITGAIVVADVVLNRSDPTEARDFPLIQDEIKAYCRTRLAPHEIPVTLRQVPMLEMAASGKLVRDHA